MAKLQSEVDSQVMQLVQQKNALLGIKNRMEKDYHMISGRYLKLFNGLNANLKQRIFELDRPTIDFAVKEIDKISNRTKYLTATIPVMQIESLSASQKIVASNIKHKGLNVITSMKIFLSGMNNQKKLTDQILINDARFRTTSSINIIIYECNRDKTDRNAKILVSNVQHDNLSVSTIKNTVFAQLSQINWKK